MNPDEFEHRARTTMDALAVLTVAAGLCGVLWRPIGWWALVVAGLVIFASVRASEAREAYVAKTREDERR